MCVYGEPDIVIVIGEPDTIENYDKNPKFIDLTRVSDNLGRQSLRNL